MRIPSSSPVGAAFRGLAAATFLLLASALPAHAFDTDGDGIQDGVDNCPFAANPGQQDTGGLGAGSPPDGIGNACQCGDASGDGRVTLTDSVIVQRAQLQPPTATLTRPELCDVSGDGNCSIVDATIVKRALLSPATASIQPVCSAAKAPAPILNVPQPVYGAFILPGPGNQCVVPFVGNVPNVENSDLALFISGQTIPTVNSAFNTTRTLTGPLESNLVEARRNSTFQFTRVNKVESCSDSIPANSTAFSSIGVRVNDRGLDRIEPVLATTVAQQVGNVGTLVRNLSPIAVNQCVLDASVGCVINLDSVSISNAGLGAFGIGLDSQINQVAVNASANNLFADYDAELTGPNCQGRVTATTVTLTGALALQPLASDRHNIDVNLVSGPTIGLVNFRNTFTGGICNFPILDSLINSFAESQIRDTVVNSVTNALKDPDGGGPADSPLADAAESALAGISVSGTVGAALGIDLDAQFQSIVEDNDGVTFRVDANVNPASLDPLSPNPGSSLKLPSVFPTYGAVTPCHFFPCLAQPYGVALDLDVNVINKLLRSEVAKGTFKLDVTTLNFDLVNPALGLGTQTLTTALLGLILPQFLAVSPSEPIVIQARPTLAPAVLDPTDVQSGTEVVRAAGVAVDFVGVSSGKHYLRLAVDGNIGLNVNVVASAIDVTLSGVTGLKASLLEDNLGGVSQATVTILMSIIAPLGNLSLTQSLESIPLPSVLGISLVPRLIDNDFNGNFLGLYLDLN